MAPLHRTCQSAIVPPLSGNETHCDSIIHSRARFSALENGNKELEEKTVDKWDPRALDMFGHSNSSGSEKAVQLGIKRWRNEEARKMYIEEITPILEKIGLRVPDENADRRVV